MKNWEILFENQISKIATLDDPAHDLLHFKRVVSIAKKLTKIENANPEVTIPAAWLHDFVIIPKNSPLRNLASKLSADKAVEFLASIKYPTQFHSEIAHAIECHSFSAGKTPNTLEAMIVQDADRLDGLGAIGIARCFATAGLLKRSFYNLTDPFCEDRLPDDGLYTIDHFYKKLFKTSESLKTESGRSEGKRRAEFMTTFLNSLKAEISES